MTTQVNSLSIKPVDVSNFADFDGHERVMHCHDPVSGLQAYIGIHNRNLGPALGGCRIWPYASHEQAITDVLRLSRGMTYKSAVAQLPLGGGKAVIIGDPRTIKTPALLAAMGRFVDSLGGAYITAEDSGTKVEDLQAMGKETRHVAGIALKPRADGSQASGDPSPSTAYGVFVGIRAAALACFGSDDLAGRRVAVQGAGNVGGHLVELLVNAGARVQISDLFESQTERLRQRLPVEVVDNASIHRADVDIFAPCALGGVISLDNLDEIRAPVIAGAANNQLATAAAGERLFRMGKVYAPDYVINAGGIIDIYHERAGYDHQRVMAHIEGIGDSLKTIFAASAAEGRPAHEMADRLAEARFKVCGGAKSRHVA